MAVKKRRRVARKSRRPEPKAKPAHSGMDRNFENFVEEIAERGRRAGHHKERAKDWWYSTFGAIGPLLGAAVCMVFVAIVAWVLLAANTVTGAPFLSLVSTFLFTNLPAFLLIFLISNYLKHIYLSQKRLYYLIKPIKVAFDVVVAFWLLGWAMQFAGMQLGSEQMMQSGLGLIGSLGGIFAIFLLLGYIVAMIMRWREDYGCCK